jgi:hypothetical protein
MQITTDEPFKCVLFVVRTGVVTSHVINFRVEAGSNTSTVTLRIVGGDEKGSLEFETVKYGH